MKLKPPLLLDDRVQMHTEFVTTAFIYGEMVCLADSNTI